MDDMGTPSSNHPAWSGLGRRTEGQFEKSNVYDLTATRAVKNLTGQTVPVKLDTTPTSPSEEDHMNTVIRD